MLLIKMTTTIIAIILMILLSAFFSASETAYLSADRLQFELEKGQGKLITKLQEFFLRRPSQYIASLLVGNNIVNVIYGVLIAKVLETPLRQLLSNDLFVVSVQTIISTAIIIIFGEYIPKTLAKRRPNKQFKWSTLPLFLVYWVMYPITLLTNALTWVFLKILGVNKDNGTIAPLGKIDLDYYLENNTSTDEEPTSEARLLQNALDFSDVKVRNCLIPRNEITALSDLATLEDLQKLFQTTGHSKILVYHETIDNIVGYIHSIEMFSRHIQDTPWQSHINQTVYVPESLPADKAMKLLLQKKRNLAVVVDELGGTAGMVTIEDIVEEIFGEIEDEHDNSNILMRKISDKEYILSGRSEISVLNDTFHLDLAEEDDYKTLAGLILSIHQEFPDKDEYISIPPHYQAKVLRATENKITLVKLERIDH